MELAFRPTTVYRKIRPLASEPEQGPDPDFKKTPAILETIPSAPVRNTEQEVAVEEVDEAAELAQAKLRLLVQVGVFGLGVLIWWKWPTIKGWLFEIDPLAIADEIAQPALPQ